MLELLLKERLMIVKLAYIFGIAFIIAGIAGFIPVLNPNGFLLGLFHVNDLHNYFHLLAGAAALLCALAGTNSARYYFQVFGLIYAALALLGFFVYGDTPIFGLIANNTADNWLHAVTALVALTAGFLWRD